MALATGFEHVGHTVVVSDIHLADAEPPHPRNPLWKRFKRPKLFVDRTFKLFLEYIQAQMPRPIELVLNGDIFDFDSVMVIPENPPFSVSWLERLRGLSSEEPKSRFKINLILNDHRVWLEALREFILNGNRVVFVIGNHDMELHWPGVQQDILNRLELPEHLRANVRFCEWFYISNGDTLIEHGNQYDNYCLCSDPIHPLIKKGNTVYVRLPFGNLAGKFMTNGMGLMNPHVESSYIKSTIYEYMVFYYRYVFRTQPFLIWTWFWGAIVTLVYSIGEGLLPALKDPLMTETRVENVAERSNATPRIVRLLRELHVHPAIYNPAMILKELWLDRFLLLMLIFFGTFELYLFVNIFMQVPLVWFFVPILLFMPVFIFYANTVESEIKKIEKATLKRVPVSGKIAKVQRVVHGHSHHEIHSRIEDVELLNPGTWSAAYHDVECTKPYGRKCYVWIRPNPTLAAPGSASGGELSQGRVAQLMEWKEEGPELVPVSPPIQLPGSPTLE